VPGAGTVSLRMQKEILQSWDLLLQESCQCHSEKPAPAARARHRTGGPGPTPVFPMFLASLRAKAWYLFTGKQQILRMADRSH
jgi:hypothetical protein